MFASFCQTASINMLGGPDNTLQCSGGCSGTVSKDPRLLADVVDIRSRQHCYDR
jgi:hypothetical protein